MGIFSFLFGKKEVESQSTTRNEFALQQANRLNEILHDSMDLASNSKNIETRKHRLELSIETLDKLKKHCKEFPFIKMENLVNVERDIYKLALELGVPVDADFSNDIYSNNQDIIKGCEFHATMNTTTPLDILKHHGEVFNGVAEDAPQYGDISQGIWLPKLDSKFDILEKGRTCWTPIGAIEPSKYLPFLIHFRKIVDSLKSGDEKLEEFLKIENIPEFKEFWLKHKEKGDNFYMQYIYGDLCDIPYVSTQYLYEQGYRRKIELIDKPDKFWLDIKGIGKAKLGKIKESLN